MMRRILRTPDPEALARLAASLVAASLAPEAASGRRRLVLAGGDTPRATYARLAQLGDVVPWSQVDVVTSDERCVPPADARSNYAMLEAALLRPLAHAGVAPRAVRLRGEDPPELAARAAEAALRDLWGAPRPDGAPRLDLVLLGLGEDGHVASLLPGAPELDVEERWVIAVAEPTRGTQRLTLTRSLLADTRRLVFLVAGAAKREAVRRAVTAAAPTAALPATLVAAAAPEVWWLLDDAAASALPPGMGEATDVLPMTR
jgi:6-phosphogluconolactonase